MCKCFVWDSACDVVSHITYYVTIPNTIANVIHNNFRAGFRLSKINIISVRLFCKRASVVVKPKVCSLDKCFVNVTKRNLNAVHFKFQAVFHIGRANQNDFSVRVECVDLI